jgi:phosphoglycolate phosphatase-like HAD superfamily hydrolase
MAGRQITHVLWDMDGVILDTESFYTVVQKQILAKYGREFTWALKAKMMGKKALEAAAVLIEDLHLGGQLSAEEFVDMREVELDRMFPTAQLMPGAERVIRHLQSAGVAICVATSSHARHFAMKTQNHTELFALFDHIVTGARLPAPSPCPSPPPAGQGGAAQHGPASPLTLPPPSCRAPPQATRWPKASRTRRSSSWPPQGSAQRPQHLAAALCSRTRRVASRLRWPPA